MDLSSSTGYVITSMHEFGARTSAEPTTVINRAWQQRSFEVVEGSYPNDEPLPFLEGCLFWDMAEKPTSVQGPGRHEASRI